MSNPSPIFCLVCWKVVPADHAAKERTCPSCGEKLSQVIPVGNPPRPAAAKVSK